jgi:hypothetical protein
MLTLSFFRRYRSSATRIYRSVLPLKSQWQEQQSGHAIIEWLIVCLPLLWLGSLVIEVSSWHSTRQQLALVAQQATVFASLSGGQSQAVQKHLKQHLPAHIRGALKICVNDQVAHLMRDFQDKRLSQQLGHEVIRHDHIVEQHKRFLAKGWPKGQGPQSRKTISAANLLDVTVKLDHRPASPWIRYLVPKVAIVTHHKAVMQSHRTQNPQACVTLKNN